MILVYIVFWFHQINLTNAQSQCNPDANRIQGKYSCSINRETDITELTCTVVGHECTATHISFQAVPGGTETTLRFDVQLTMKAYTTKPVQVTVKQKSDSSIVLLNNYQMTYTFNYDEQPRITFDPVIVPSDDGFTAFSTSDAYLSEITQTITQDNSEGTCTLSLSQSPRSQQNLLFYEKVALRLTSTTKICGERCEKILKIPQEPKSASLKSYGFSHTFACEDPIVSTIGHDQFKREITFTVNANYKFKKVEITVATGSVTISNPNPSIIELSNSATFTQQNFEYAIIDASLDDKKFNINYKITQENDKYPKTISKSYEYNLKSKETSSIFCKPKEEANLEFRANKYLCDIVSHRAKDDSNTITLLVDQQYTISEHVVTLEKRNGVMIKKDHEITIRAPNDVKCKERKRIKISFSESEFESAFHVTHFPNCKEPTISCASHNLVQRSIQCQINIEFSYHKIKLESSNVVVRLDKNEISFPTLGLHPFTETISYHVKDLRNDAKNYFKIIFTVLQHPNDPTFEISKAFEYVIKNEDVAHIKCDINTGLKLENYASMGYSCEGASSDWKLKLSLDDRNFDVTPTDVEGFSVEQIYKHKFDITLTPKTIKCNERKDVKISFEEQGKSHDFTVSHLTTCPEPLINCDSHNFVSRSIDCKIHIIFEYTKIKIESEDQKVTLISNSDVKAAEIKKKNNIITFNYKVNDLKTTNHQFKIKFTIQHATGEDAAVKTLEFTYTLKKNEIPSLVCNEKPRERAQLFQETKYTCTIISHSNPARISTDTEGYNVVPASIVTSQAADGIYTIENHEISITPQTVVCDKQQVVPIFFTDGQSKREFSITHKTECPEPEIYCDGNNMETRKLKCKVKIDFAFESVSLTTLPGVIHLDTNSIMKEGDKSGIDKEVQITYSIKDIKRKDHSFGILFKVIQSGNENAYNKKLYFNYNLRPSELPQITCKEKSSPNADFKQNDFQCTVISKEKHVTLKIDNSDYTLATVQTDGNDYQMMFKHENKDITISINEVVCGKSEKIRVYLIDLEESTEYSDYVTHRTICPDPTVTEISSVGNERKLEWTIVAKFKFTKVEFVSDVVDVSVSPSHKIIECTTEECSQIVQINYEPLDWSFDEHKFHVINKITPKGSSPVAIKTSLKTFVLEGKELPFLTCQLDQTQKTTIFFEKDYICNIQSRQSSVTLSIKDSNYRIVKAHGTSTTSKNIYTWNNHQIVVKDLLIKCNVDVALEVEFSEYGQTYKSNIKYRTTCPKPVITCDKHDVVLRTVECVVTSKFPHTSVEIQISGKVDLLTVTHSTVKNVGDEWISVHVVPYKLKDLLDSNHNFGLNVAVLQDTMTITREAKSFEYTIAKDEQLQISCKRDESQSKLQFDSSVYSCYIVAKTQQISLAIGNEEYIYIYILRYDQNVEGIQFVNVFKWEDFKVVVRDTKIYCNETKTIKLQAIAREEKYETSVEHTTHCNQIHGDCIVYENIFSYIQCNYSSVLNFQLNNYTCSEHINCTISFESNRVPSKVHELLLQISPLTSLELFEFDMNVTLSYSEHSTVTFNHQFDYNKEIEISRQASAAVKSEAKSSVLFIATIFAVCVLFVLGYSKRESFKPIINIETFRDYYNSL